MSTSLAAHTAMIERLMSALSVSRGHFRYESGHHGDLWLDLDPLFLRPETTRAWAGEIAASVSGWGVEVACGPLTGGALLAQLVALELDVDYVHAERSTHATGGVHYQVPAGMRTAVRGRRVLVVDDAINAGSALQLTLADLDKCGAIAAGVAALLTLGPAAAEIAAQRHVPLATLARVERSMWSPSECPLCAAGVAVE